MSEVTEIIANDISKKFNNKWIIKDFSQKFSLNQHFVIIGPNGSGKSTLAQMIAGVRSVSKGKVEYFHNSELVDENDSYKMISFASPYQELPEDLTLLELMNFHTSVQKLRNNLTIDNFIDIVNLKPHKNKQIRNYSSGMMQRLKLGLAVLSETKFVFLDEPTSNLDTENIIWYKNLVLENLNNRCFIVCSNENEEEYSFCNNRIEVLKYK